MNRNVDRSRDVCEPCHDTADISRWTAIRTQCCSQGSTILNMQNAKDLFERYCVFSLGAFDRLSHMERYNPHHRYSDVR